MFLFLIKSIFCYNIFNLYTYCGKQGSYLKNLEYRLESIESRLYILKEYFDGLNLNSYIDQKEIQLNNFLIIAIEITNALSVLHKQNKIHANLSPNCIFIDTRNHQIMLTGLSVDDGNQLFKDMAYRAPEQSNRVGYKVSNNTDIYSLGTIFYKMLSGHLPFDNTDEIGLLHSQVAKEAPPLLDILPELPLVVSNIISKMLHKDPTKRYYDLSSLQNDLKICLKSIKREKKVLNFEIDNIGRISQFNPGNTLFGVDNQKLEIKNLLSNMDFKSTTLLSVIGVSGVGKSAISKYALKQTNDRFGYILENKFEQYKNYSSYEILYPSLQNLIKQILSEDESVLSRYRNKITEALGEHANIIIDIVPELKIIIGEQPSVEILSAQDTKVRLDRLLINFLKVFSIDKPLCIFFEDLQWADNATISLLKTALHDISNLLVIITYRDNEINEKDSLNIMLKELEHYEINTKEIKLVNMNKSSIHELLSQCINKDIANKISGIIFYKTNGNSFFVVQYIKRLIEEHAIWFDNEEISWQCDIEKIKKLPISDNVLDLLVSRAKGMSENVQNLLKIASCIGSKFSEKELKLIYNNDAEFYASLDIAIEEEWLVEETYNNQKYYSFIHDKMQETSYSTLGKDEKKKIHLDIGMYLFNKQSSLDGENLLLCINHLDQAFSLITSADILLVIAKLYFVTSLQVKSTGDFTMALYNVKRAMTLMPQLLEDYSESLIYKERAECEHLCNNKEKAIKYYNLAINSSNEALEKAYIYELMIKFYTDISEFEEAYNIGRIAANLFNINLPSGFIAPLFILDFIKLKFKLKNYKVAQLLDLPEASDASINMLIRILSAMLKAAYQIKPELCVAISLKLVTLCLKHGNTREAVVGYMVFGVIFQGAVLGNHTLGYKYAQLALNMINKHKNTIQQAEVEFVCNYFSNSWVNSSKNSEENWYKAYRHGLEVGDWFHSGCAAAGIVESMFIRGRNFEEILKVITSFESTLNRIGASEQLGAIISVKQTISNLKGLTDSISSYNDDSFKEEQYVDDLNDYGSRHFAHYYFINKMISLYIRKEYEKAFEISILSKKYMSDSKGMLHSTEHEFYNALILARLFKQSSVFNRLKYKYEIHKTIKLFKKYSKGCKENFLARTKILEGEYFCINKNFIKAFECYEIAIESADVSGFSHIQAIANMLIADMYLSAGQTKASIIFEDESRRCFNSWGVNCNSSTLNIRENKVSSSLDVETLMKSTEVISKEQKLPNLLQTLIRIVIENAGAQYGILLLEEEGQLFVQAEGSIDSETVMQNIPYKDAQKIVHSIVNYVQRTKEALLLDNASESSIFKDDTDILKRKVKSVLCIPLQFQG
ncbi:MAG: putative ATPase, partial [Sulfurimonas sp.]